MLELLSFDDFIKDNLHIKHNIDIDTFTKKFTIQYTNPITLYDYFEKLEKSEKYENDIRRKNKCVLIEKLYNEFVIFSIETNRRFFNAYLKTTLEMKKNYWTFKEIMLDNNRISVQKNDASKKIIRNLFYRQLLEYTQITTSLPHKFTLLKTWKRAFNELILDDRYFSPSVVSQYLRNEPIHYFFQQYQPKASIINPYTIFWLLEFYFPKLVPDTNIMYTPVLSWGSYALAFAHTSLWKHYIGIDVMDSVCEKSIDICDYYFPKDKTYEITKGISEGNLYIYETYNSKVDLIFTCPPYFKMEMYSENIETQSTEIYTEYSDWLKMYWLKTVENCFHVLKNKGIFAFIVGNYTDYKTKIKYDLITDCNKIIQESIPNLIQISHFELVNRTSPLRNNDKIRSEFLFVYQKS